MYELLHLLDMPGLNDTRPWANYNINQAMGSSTDLLLLVNRNLKSDESTLQAAINSGWAAHQVRHRQHFMHAEASHAWPL
jgi:hypothetical protein